MSKLGCFMLFDLNVVCLQEMADPFPRQVLL